MAIDIPIVTFDEIDSTNAEAMRWIAAGQHGPRWLRAAVQTAGRGRAGRPWSTQPGNFAGSLIWPLRCPPAIAHQLSLVVAVGLHDAVCQAAPEVAPALRLKWPNDLLLDGAKLSGTLIESTSTPDGLIAVIGIGVNLAQAPEGLDRAVTSLAARGVVITPQAFVETLSEALAATFVTWADGRDFPLIRDAWRERALPIGTAMSIKAGDEPIAGTFGGINDDGALELELRDGTRRTFTFGDVWVASR